LLNRRHAKSWKVTIHKWLFSPISLSGSNFNMPEAG
jgi:hypothetical protein